MTKAKKKKEKKQKLDTGGDPTGGTNLPSAGHGIAREPRTGNASKHISGQNASLESSSSDASDW